MQSHLLLENKEGISYRKQFLQLNFNLIVVYYINMAVTKSLACQRRISY